MPPDDERNETSGILDQLRTVVEALADIEEEEGGHRRNSGHIDRRHARVDYEYDVSIGLGKRLPRPDEAGEARSSAVNSREFTVPAEITDVEGSDERIVVADVGAVTEDEVDVSLDRDRQTLEISANDDIVTRIGLDRTDLTVTDVSLNNQVLQIRLQPRSTGESDTR